MACANGYPEIVKYLLENGADPNAVNQSMNTPLRKIAYISNIVHRLGRIKWQRRHCKVVISS